MKQLIAATIWLVAVAPAAAQFGPPQFGPPPSATPGSATQPFTTMPASSGGMSIPAGVRPHPAVCRIVAPNREGESWGSGTLIDVTDRYGLVLTNWHVVNEAAGEISVLFPDGFRSGGRLLKVDRDWDLAAIAIWRPNIQPVPLSSKVPQPGELLTIAGYGSGSYRAVSGRCTQYLSPGDKFPFDMIELSAAARNGDSGGPILNNRGELAGVLFGEGDGRTSGSHVGRVRWFLASVLPGGQQNAPTATDVARNAPGSNSGALAAVPKQPAPSGGLINTPTPPSSRDRGPPAAPIAQRTEPAAGPWPAAQPSTQAIAPRPQPGVVASAPVISSPAPAMAADSGQWNSSADAGTTIWQQVAGVTPIDRLKSILATLGVLAGLTRILRWVRK